MPFVIVVVAFRPRQVFERSVLKTQLVKPVERLRREQEDHPESAHPGSRHQVPHDRRADSRLAVVRRNGNRCDFRRVVLERVERPATVNHVVDRIHDIVRKLFRNGFLRSRNEISLGDVVLHNPKDIRDIVRRRRADARILVRIDHRSVAAAREHFLQDASLRFAADEVHALRAGLAGGNGVFQIIDLRKIQPVRIQVQNFLRLLDIQCGNFAVVRHVQIPRIRSGQKAVGPDAVFASDEEELPDRQILAKFHRKFRTRNVVGVTNLVPTDRRDDGDVILRKQMLDDVLLDPLNPTGSHVIDAIDNSKAPSRYPVSLHSVAAARRQMAHNALGRSERRLFDQGQRFFARQAHAVLEFRNDFPRGKLPIDALPRPGNNQNLDPDFVQERNVPNQYGKQRMFHQAVFDFQHKKLSFEPGDVAEDFANESRDLDILHVQMVKTVAHAKKYSYHRLFFNHSSIKERSSRVLTVRGVDASSSFFFFKILFCNFVKQKKAIFLVHFLMRYEECLSKYYGLS